MPVLKPNFSEIGRSGLNHYSGYIKEEFLRELSGLRWRKVVKEMLWNDAVIASMFFAIEMLIRQVEWDVTPASEDGEDEQAAEFVKECLHDMEQPWKDTLSEILSFLPWGWSLHEKVFKRRNGMSPGTFKDGSGEPRSLPRSKFTDNKIAWSKWASRSQDSLSRWEMYENGDPKAMVQSSPPDYKQRIIPLEKSILFRTSAAKGNPEGQSMLRAVYRSWYFKQNIENIEGIGIERDLAGIPYATMPADYLAATEGDMKTVADEIKNIVTSLRNGDQASVAFPSNSYEGTNVPMFELKLLSTGGTRQFDTNKIIQRYDQRILMRLMSDFIVLGHEKVGSFALSSSKTNMFSIAIGAWLDSICETINRDAIPELLSLNGMSIDNPPRLTHGDIEKMDLTELGEFISKLSGSGVKLNAELLGYALKEAGFPEQEDDALEEMLEEPEPPSFGLPELPLNEEMEASEPPKSDRKMMRRSWIKHAPKGAKGMLKR